MINYKTEIKLKSNSNYNINFKKFKHLKNKKELIFYLFDLIPENLHSRFINNLEKVKFGFRFDEKNYIFHDKSNDDDITFAFYSLFENEILFCLNSIGNLISQTNGQKFKIDYLIKKVSFIYLHELTHLASSRFEVDEKMMYTGFTNIDYDKNISYNLGITEGMTDIITNRAFPTIDNNVGYYEFATAFAGQLCTILSFEFMAEEYFKANGINNIILKLNEYVESESNRKVFNIIEFLYLTQHHNDNPNLFYNGPGHVQKYMFEMFKIELVNKIANNKDSLFETLEYINDFEKYMITPYRLYDMDLPYDQFPGIYDIYLEFNDLKNGIMKVFAKELTKQDRQRTKTC